MPGLRPRNDMVLWVFLFIKRWFYYLGLYFVIAYFDINFGAFLGEWGFYITHTDGFLQRWRLRARCYLANSLAIGIHNFVIVPRDAPLKHFKA